VKSKNAPMNVPSPAGLQVQGPTLVHREDREHVAFVVLNRPQARNALSAAMLDALTQTLAAIEADDNVRAVVLAGNGPAFCAGHDLREITQHRTDDDRGLAYTKNLMDACSAVMMSIHRLPQPVIAAIEGPASAAGCQLVASCDLAVASTSASFATPGVHIGLFCSTPMVALSRSVAPKHAMEMLLTGDLIPAEEAHRIGLINRVVPQGQAKEAAFRLAKTITAKSAATIKLGKEAFYRQIEMTLPEAYRFTGQVMVDNMMMQDAEEGISAFVEKRVPAWKDR
jgi:enoyl-CoA hydratase/carnithine racemase